MTRAVFRRSQIGPEAVAGTPITLAASLRQLAGVLSIKDAPERLRRDERRASMGGSNTWQDHAYRSELQYTGRCVPQELPFFLANAIRGDVTPAASIWTYTQPLTTIPALKPLTCYGGDNTQAVRASGCFTRQLTIEGRDTAALTMTAEMFGRQAVLGTFGTGPLTTMAGTTARNLLSRVYINDTGAAIGSNALVATAYGFRWVWTSGLEPDYTMDNSLDMIDIHRDEPTCVLDITAKWNAEMVAEFGHAQASGGNMDTRFVRIVNSDVSGANIITIDGAYKITDFTPLAEERNGTTIATVQLTAVEDTTWGKKIEVSVKNTLTSADLPVA